MKDWEEGKDSRILKFSGRVGIKTWWKSPGPQEEKKKWWNVEEKRLRKLEDQCRRFNSLELNKSMSFRKKEQRKREKKIFREISEENYFSQILK